MNLKLIIIFLVFAGLIYSTAPSWITKDVSLNYSSGSSKVFFNVINRTQTDLIFEVKTSNSPKPSKATENLSAQSGQFWFDSKLLADASTGSIIGDYSVVKEGKLTFAGKEWDTITLEIYISGAKNTKIYDKKTGLMLKQTVSAEGAPEVTLLALYVPEWAPPPPPVQEKKPNGPVLDDSAPNVTDDEVTDNVDVLNDDLQVGEVEQKPASSPAPEKKPLPCCPSAIILGVLGIVIMRSR